MRIANAEFPTTNLRDEFVKKHQPIWTEIVDKYFPKSKNDNIKPVHFNIPEEILSKSQIY